MNQRKGVLAALLLLSLLLGGCASGRGGNLPTPGLTELKRFAREQLAANLQKEVPGRYEILGASSVSHSSQSNQFAADFDVDITDDAGHTRYASYEVVVGLDAEGAMVVLDIGPQTTEDFPLN